MTCLWLLCEYGVCAEVVAEKKKNLEDLLLVLGLRLPRGCYRIAREPQRGQQPYLRSLCNILWTCFQMGRKVMWKGERIKKL